MNAIGQKVDELVNVELESACANFPLFDSAHEAYAIILEEVEEAEEKLDLIRDRLDLMWKMIRQNRPKDGAYIANTIIPDARDLACEAMQVAAMCKKYMRSAERGFTHEVHDAEI